MQFQRECKQTLQRTIQGSEPKKGGDTEAVSKQFCKYTQRKMRKMLVGRREVVKVIIDIWMRKDLCIIKKFIDTKLYRVNGNRNSSICLSFFRFGNKSPRESMLLALPQSKWYVWSTKSQMPAIHHFRCEF